MKQCALLSCGRPALADPQAQGYCILHAPWDGKDLSAFQAAIDEIIEKARQGSGVCDFSHCYFPSNYDCRDLEQAFEFHCNFYGSKFAGYADFNQVKFSGGAIFWKAEFFGVVAFTGAKFSKSAVFEEAKFSKDAYFTGAEFSGDAVFWRANFSENAYFWGVKFFEYATFEEAEFSGNTHFEGAEFRQRADFSRVETAKDATVDFQRIRLLKPQQVFFHHVDLSRWSFLDTDLRRIDFDDVTWGTIRRLLSRRIALFDELNVSNQKDELAKVERLYRHLKQNYEANATTAAPEISTTAKWR
jgi:uncharacterized protein YjbI with pentapeptide repeats